MQFAGVLLFGGQVVISCRNGGMMAACQRMFHGFRNAHVLLKQFLGSWSLVFDVGSASSVGSSSSVVDEELGWARGGHGLRWSLGRVYVHGSGRRKDEGDLRGVAAKGVRGREELVQEIGAASLKDHLESTSRFKQSPWRAGEAKFVDKICCVINQGGWGGDTVNELQKLNARLRSKLVNKVLRQLENPDLAYRFFQWAREQPSFHHSLYAYHAMIEIMGGAQKFDTQYQLLQDMHRHGLQANTSTFNIIILGFSRANNPNSVLNTFNMMGQYGCSPNAFTFKCVIRSLVWSGRALEALSVYGKMLEFGFIPDNFTYNGLIEGLCKAGHVDEAFCIFQEMEERGLSPDSLAHAALIKGLDMKGRIDEACRMFQEMTGKNLRTVVDTHKGMMGVFSKRHKDDLFCSESANV